MSAHSTMDTIDLTGERREHAISQPSLALSGAPDHAAASGTASRVQRPPRFPRDIIDLADSDEEEQQHQPVQRPAQNQHTTGNLHMLGRDDLFMPQMEADEDSLFIPEAPPTRPTTAGLRRPGYRRRPTPAMEFDDVEIVSSRPISRNVSRRATPAVFMPGQTATDNPPPRQSANDPIDLTADDDDEVIHTNTRPLPSINGERPAMAGSGIGTRERPLARGDFGIGRLVERIRGRDGMRGMRGQDAMTANFLNRYANMNYGNNEDAAARSHAAHDIARRRADQAHERTMRAEEQLWRAQERPGGVPGRIVRQRGHVVMNPITMDYNELGFDIMGVGPPEPATPKYEPPPPAEKGFTRSPEEDEEVVCPNCGDELAVGKEEMKQQIWVVKGCGHVSDILIVKYTLLSSKANLYSGILWRVCHTHPSNHKQEGQR